MFDRRTGTPVWPIEERPVPQSTVPGERTSATQPFPTKPPAFERQGLTESDLIDFTPELKQAALEAIKPFDYGPLFTPPSEKGTIAHARMGRRRQLGRRGVRSRARHALRAVGDEPDCDPAREARSRRRATCCTSRGGVQAPPTLDGLPIVKPPYGRVTAIDLNKGETKWVTAVGDGPREHPLLKDLNLPPLGAPLRNAPLVTKSLLFIAMGQGNLGGGRNLPVGGRPLSTGVPAEPIKLRAYDKATGALVWDFVPPSRPLASPMTYMYQGVQYLVVATGSGATSSSNRVHLAS